MMNRTGRSGKMIGLLIVSLLFAGVVHGESRISQEDIYPLGKLRARDSEPLVKVGDPAPDFALPSIKGEKISLSQYRGKMNVVLSFIPAAWTPVCTMQWPIYDVARDIFEENDAVLLGISVDNIPTLYAWTKNLSNKGEGVWFPVLSDFFPHGQVARRFGILRRDGTSERAIFIIDKKGIIRYIDVHDINERPPLMALAKSLEEVAGRKK